MDCGLVPGAPSLSFGLLAGGARLCVLRISGHRFLRSASSRLRGGEHESLRSVCGSDRRSHLQPPLRRADFAGAIHRCDAQR